MRLLYVNNALAIHGGLERIITDKVNWLAANTDHEIYVVTFDQGNHPTAFPLHSLVRHTDLGVLFHQQYRYSGVKRWKCNYKLHRLLRQRLREKIQEIAPDIIVCCQKQFVPDVEQSRGRIPLVFECHSAYLAGVFEHFSFIQRLRNKSYDRYIRKVQKVVALTNGDAAEWRKVNPQVEVIPNMVHLNETGLCSDCRSKSAIFVGRYTAQKDIGSLLRIWRIVNSRHPDWQLHLYGGYGNEPGKWQREVSRMNANVFIHKPTSQVFDRYRESSMLLLTSLHEPFGLVLPEAMSCGLPVVSFDCPYGPADIINDGVDGFLIKDRDIEAFANRVCQLIDDEALRVEVGKAAIASSQRYQASLIMPLWIKMFKQVVGIPN